MSKTIPQPKPVQLQPPGPYVLPVADSFLALALAPGTGPVQQLRFVDAAGAEFHVPLSQRAYNKLETELLGAYLKRTNKKIA
jgi:hypothetical protein